MAIKEELEFIQEQNGGMLRAEDVVAFARDDKTALHNKFEWDNAKASEQYRLIQARNVIRVQVAMHPETLKTYRVHVSLLSDRQVKGGGYRKTEDVMRQPDHRAALLMQAMKEAQAWRQRYQQLDELAQVFAALDDVEADEEAVG